MSFSNRIKAVFFALLLLLSNVGIPLHIHHCFTCNETEVSLMAASVQCHDHCSCVRSAEGCCSLPTGDVPRFDHQQCCLHEDIGYLIPVEVQPSKNQQTLIELNHTFVRHLFSYEDVIRQTDVKLQVSRTDFSPPPLPYPGTDREIAYRSLKIFPHIV